MSAWLFRVLNTLYTLGSSPEPNLTILWSNSLPENFKRFCAKVSADTDSIQYENDDIMRPIYGDDYAIACCVSAMKVGKQMQFFGARCNLAKLLLIAINGGYDTTSGMEIGPQMPVMDVEKLDYDEVMERYDIYVKWLSRLYVNTMNIIHCMHDKYAYEKIQMALHDTDVHRFMAFGIAGLSVVADSLSAIKYANVKPIIKDGYIVDFDTTGEFPKYGNDDDRVDLIAKERAHNFITELRRQLKCAFDRLFAVAECNENLANPQKECALLMAAEGNGYEETLYWYDRLMKHLGWTDKGKVLCGGVFNVGDIKGNPKLKEAFNFGKKLK